MAMPRWPKLAIGGLRNVCALLRIAVRIAAPRSGRRVGAVMVNGLVRPPRNVKSMDFAFQ